MKLVHSQAERPQRNSLPSHILIPFLSILVVSAIVSVRFEVFRLDSSPPNPKRREKLVPDVFNSPKKALMEAGDTKVGQEYEKNAEIDVSIVVEEAQQDSDKKDERKENRIPEWIDPFRPPHNAKPPAWCEILINNPREFPRGELYGECGRKHNDVLCADGKPMYFGSHNQDMYTYNHHFKNLNRPGVFLDIAANDPVSRSNTFFYEKCLGWKGLCIEANPRYHDLLHRMRTCAIVKTCVSDKVMNVTFVDDAGNGGILSTNKNRETAKKRNKFRKMTCVKTDTALLQGEKMEIDWFTSCTCTNQSYGGNRFETSWSNSIIYTSFEKTYLTK